MVLLAGSLYAAQIHGVVRDLSYGEGIGFAEIQIIELKRGVVAHADGEYHIPRLPDGMFTVRASRIGYHSRELVVTLKGLAPQRIDFPLELDHVTMPEVVTETRRERPMAAQSFAVEGRELQERMASSVADAFAGVNGLTARTMGPAPARPVARGMSGARLLVLEDGRPTGDLSASSSDYAVAIDPLLAERMTLVRGPRAYHFGSSVMSGVVNVERRLLLGTEPHRLAGRVMFHGQSVDQSAASSLTLAVPVSVLALHVEASAKRSGVLRTPDKILLNTQAQLASGRLGASIAERWGNAAVSYNRFSTEYGLPGGFLGAHPQGVSVDLLRELFQSSVLWHVKRSLIEDIRADYIFTRVHQREYEASGALGVEFGVLNDRFGVELELAPFAGLHDVRVSGDFSLRDYETAAFSFTPDSRLRTYGVVTSAARRAGNWQLTAALRSDLAELAPDFQDTSRVVGIIRDRRFSGASGAFRGDRILSDHWSIGLQAARSFRAPEIEELYSEGPHLAAYSYEIGNPDLPAEHGWGLETDVEFHLSSLSATAAVFSNRFTSYIFPQPTGRPSAVRNDLELYQYKAADALLSGAELSCELSFTDTDAINGSVSYVSGNLLGLGALPAMPPLSGKVAYVKQIREWHIASELTGSLCQRELGEFERPTAAYMRADLGASRYWTLSRALVILTVSARNVLDTPYRKSPVPRQIYCS
ncbi:MAG: TonB-dependent receptor [bacterium]|nr:TonB-dependent receptor [bacterium]